jgi:hypothetical protein
MIYYKILPNGKKYQFMLTCSEFKDRSEIHLHRIGSKSEDHTQQDEVIAQFFKKLKFEEPGYTMVPDGIHRTFRFAPLSLSTLREAVRTLVKEIGAKPEPNKDVADTIPGTER